MKKITVLVVSLLALLFIQTASANIFEKKAQLLFVLIAKQGQIQVDKNNPGMYQLTLTKVDPSVIYFADRPKRFSGQTSVDEFLQNWAKGPFKKDPPNGVMEAVRLYANYKKEQEHTVSYAVVLTNPKYDKNKDELTFDIKSLQGNGGNPIPDAAKSDYVALFIDDCGACWGSTGPM